MVPSKLNSGFPTGLQSVELEALLENFAKKGFRWLLGVPIFSTPGIFGKVPESPSVADAAGLISDTGSKSRL